MEKRIIECVPNFSEGRNKAVIQQITSAIEAVDGVKLLDVDPGEATNRTVVTFVGEPEAVLEAAFQGVKKAAEVIDMRNHKGAHPRMGATDVCPLIPIAGITLEECAELARQLAKRIADELHVPTYCYEAAAFTPERRNLAVCRAGEYEALPEKMRTPETVAAVRADFVAYYTEHIDRFTRPYEGIPELLRELVQRGVRLAVASNKFQIGTEKLVRIYFPSIRFDAVFGQRPGVPLKPDPQVVREILADTDAESGAVLYAGDSGVDMDTARAAGVRSVGVTWGFRDRAELYEHGADHVVDRPGEILELL